MSTCVLGQVIASHESPVTHGTHKLFLTSMRAPVSREFIRARKFFITTFPVTAERFLTCVSSEVCFQVRALEIRLLASREVADVISPAREVHLRGVSILT